MAKLPHKAGGYTMREVRQMRHLTQAELAKLMGVSIGTVQKWERFEATPNCRYIGTIEAVLGCDIHDISFGSGTSRASEIRQKLMTDYFAAMAASADADADADEGIKIAQ